MLNNKFLAKFSFLAWIKNVLPSTALQANEEAWNAYPFTRTRYSSPLLDRFSIEIETLYFNDAGTQENVFNLTDAELKQRVVGEYTKQIKKQYL